MGVKDALAEKTGTKDEVKLTKSMSIADMIKAMKPEIEKALPKVITPERFTRMALSALNTTPKLQECSQMSFLGALMNAAQLGLEPNTPLGQAYLIPYKNHGKLECQFQIGYKGLIDMVYRNDNIQTVQAQCVYENDVLIRYNVFRARLLINHAENGKKYLYDILAIKKETSKPQQ